MLKDSYFFPNKTILHAKDLFSLAYDISVLNLFLFQRVNNIMGSFLFLLKVTLFCFLCSCIRIFFCLVP